LTSHFLELLPDIIIQDNRKAPLYECKLVVKENAQIKKEKKRRALDTDSFELQTKILS